MQYRTEIHIAADRYVCLQLPDFIPAGRATVTVSVAALTDGTPDEETVDHERDGDVEWWDEFNAEDDPRRG